jgi:hypothetical protein
MSSISLPCLGHRTKEANLLTDNNDDSYTNPLESLLIADSFIARCSNVQTEKS